MIFINKDAFAALTQEDKDIYTSRSVSFKLKANGYVVNNATILSARPLSNGNVLMTLNDKTIMTVIVPKTIAENAYRNGVSAGVSRMIPNLTHCLISFTAAVSLTGETWTDKNGVVSKRTSNTLTPTVTTLKPNSSLLMILETVSETISRDVLTAQRAPIVHADELARVDD